MDIVDAWRYLQVNPPFLSDVLEQARQLATHYCADTPDTNPLETHYEPLVLLMDDLGRVVHANDALLQLTSYTLAEVRGRDALTIFISPHDRRDLATRIGIVKKTGETWQYPVQVLPKDTSVPIVCLWALKVIRNGAGTAYLLAQGIVPSRLPVARRLGKKKRAHADT